MEPLSIVKYALTLVMLGYTSLLDVRTREVEPRTWVYFAVPLFLIYLYQVFSTGVEQTLIKLQWITTAAMIVVTYLLYRIGMLGGGDVFAIFIIGSTHYEVGGLIYNWPPMPLVLQTLLFASAGSLLLSLYYCTYNVIYNREKLSTLSIRDAVFYCFTAKALRVEDLIKKRYWYPLERPWDQVTLKYFRVEEDDVELLSKLTDWAKQNNAFKTKVWATYGMPFLVNILIGYILSLVGLGNLILEIIINK